MDSYSGYRCRTQKHRNGKPSFTLIELLIVVAIMAVLAAVVIPNIIGLVSRGGEESYDTDHDVIQLAASSTFYYDVHTGLVYDPNQDGDPRDTRWGCTCMEDQPGNNSWKLTHEAGHYFPTAIAHPSNHTLYLSNDEYDESNEHDQAFLVLGGSGTAGCPTCANDDDISAHSIWMGILRNAPGSYTFSDDDGNCNGPRSECGTTDRIYVSVLSQEIGLYLQEMPESALRGPGWNGAIPPGGTYCWVIGKNGVVYGTYPTTEGKWYAGFSGVYP